MMLYTLLQAPASGGSGWSQILPLILIMGVFYVFMIMPQMRKQKKQRSFLESVKKGDHVVTTGGMHGRIASISDTTISLETESGNRIKIEKAAISLEMTKSAYGDSNKNAEKTD
jgi:preprotein translocase subunit YajC